MLDGFSGECDRVRLQLAASPDIAPVVSGVADRFNDSKRKVNRFCVEIAVAAQESWQTAAILAGDPDAGSSAPPQVWIPDSSMWLDQARTGRQPAAAVLPAGGASIASSPTVVAVTKPVATQLVSDGGASAVGWGRLVRELNSDQPLTVGFPDPTRNATGVGALLSVAQVSGTTTSARARATQVSLMRKLSNGAADNVGTLFGKLPKQPDPVADGSSIAALPTTEQSVWRYNVARPAVPLVALYPAEGALRMDYPYVLTSAANDQNRARAAEMFLAELRKGSARKDFQKNGFRSPEGNPGSVLTPAVGLNPQVPKVTGKPPAQAVAAAMKSWRAVSLSSRMAVLIDISGSMNAKVPVVNRTRLEVTVSAAQQALGLFGDTSEIGLWVFSSQLVGRSQDWKELVPVGPLTDPVGDVVRRGALASALTQIAAKPNGDTGLYDTILAAYRVQRAGYRPGKINSVIVFTDGENSDPTGGVSLPQLLVELGQLSDPQRPIPVIIIAFGPETDMASARKIAAATNGTAYSVNSPAEINEVFLDAVGQRSCRPRCSG